VHGCDDSITGTSCHERMDRDYTVFLIGVVAVFLGATITVVAIARYRREDDRSGRR
jgi:hypothetical protein